MSEAVIIEFDGIGRTHYDAVNAALGLNPDSGEGEWPAGLTYHAGGAKPGGWVVFEVWDSRDEQEQFLNGRLGQALQEGGVKGPPSRVEWLGQFSSHDVSG